MYYQYFGLTEAPFSIAVNPRYLFMSDRHRDALAHLLYGVGTGGGFILLTGEVGTGKTTINRCLLEQLPPDTDVAMILNPALNSIELLATVCDELGIGYDPDKHTLKTLTDKLQAYLLENHGKGRRTVLLIDEAQHLGFDVLEQIRLLTNLETNREKLLQIILIGQPELAQMLARPELRQLNQRITARYNLDPLNLDETGAYIHHRLQVAGMSPERVIFPTSVVRGIYKASRGIPRVINVLCDRMLLGAYGRNNYRVDHAMLSLAVKEVLGDQEIDPVIWRWVGVAAVVLLLGWAGGWLLGKYAGSSVTDVSRMVSEFTALPKDITPLTEETAALPEEVVVQPQDAVVLPRDNIELHQENLELAQNITEMQQDITGMHQGIMAPLTDITASSGEMAASPGSITEPITIPFQKPSQETPAVLHPGVEVVPVPAARASDTKLDLVAKQETDDISSAMLLPENAIERLWTLHTGEQAPETPCLKQAQKGLSCFEGRVWAWDQLAAIDRPLALEVITPGGISAEVLLLGVESQTAWVLTDEGVVQVSRLDELVPLWTGQYRFFWRPPQSFELSLTPGQESDVVATVAQMFARLDAQPLPLADRRFNRALQQRVRLFQREHGLVDDGVIGVRTLIKLNEQLGIDVTAAQARHQLQAVSEER